MARKLDHSRFRTRNARLKQLISKKPYMVLSLARGVALLYRRNKKNGTWIVRAIAGDGRSYWTKAFAEADDYAEADGDAILTFYTAQDRAKELARGSDAETAPTAAPITVDRALTDYAADLKARNARVCNAQHPRVHLPAGLLAKPAMLLTSTELEHWRNSLLGKLKPATINRVGNCLRAALALAAKHDKRISNRDAWEIGLAGLPDAQSARNVVLSDAQVHAFCAAANAYDPGLGLLVDTMAVTGARPSQVVRLRVENLLDHPFRPKLMMPKSGKGGGRNRSTKKAQHYSLPITSALAKKLRRGAADRAPEAPLLVRADGSSWGGDPSNIYRRHIRTVVARIGLDPDVVTVYALRHSSVVRMLLKNVPIRLVASLHDTSVGQIERNYSRHIAEYADEHARTALLEEPAENLPAGNVVSIGGA